MRTLISTTDTRFVRVAPGQWWDTTGTEVVPQDTVDRHLRGNARVAVAVIVDEQRVLQ